MPRKNLSKLKKIQNLKKRNAYDVSLKISLSLFLMILQILIMLKINKLNF